MNELHWDTLNSNYNAFLLRFIKRPAPYHFPLHAQDYAELILFESGKGIFGLNGEEFSLRSNNLAFVRPSDQHEISTEKGSLATLLLFPVEAVRFLGNRYFQNQSDYFWSTEKCPPPIILKKEQALLIKEWSIQLAKAKSSDRFELERFLMNLFSVLPRNSTVSKRGAMPEWLRRALKEIRQPDNAKGGTKVFFELAGCSPQHTAAAMKKHLGITPTEAVRQVRMDYVAEQLRTTNESILGIALDIGFKSLGHFYQTFRTYYGMTPYHYRKTHRV